MKRVRYLAGAALAPAVAGLAVPTAANAATTTTTGGTKTVSMHGARAGCTGTVPFTIPRRGQVKGHGWRTFSSGGHVCFGTVVVSIHVSQTGNNVAHLDVLGGSGSVYSKDLSKSGVKGTSVHIDFPVHRRFLRTATICASSVFIGDRTCASF